MEDARPIPTSPDARQALAELLAHQDDAVDLVRAALLVAREEYPGLDVDAYGSRVDRLADRFKRALASVASPSLAIGRLNRLIFDEEQFKGNADDYYDPRNSYLNDVLDRKLGLPITLAIIYVAVGRGAGLRLHGVSFPAHFIVAYDPPDDDRLYVDVFGGGGLLSPSDLRAMVRRAGGDDAEVQASYLEPADNRAILARAIGNLKAVYLRRRDYRRALRASEQMSLVLADPGEHRDRGSILYQVGDLEGAATELARYLELAPAAADAEQVRQHLRHVWELRARRN